MYAEFGRTNYTITITQCTHTLDNEEVESANKSDEFIQRSEATNNGGVGSLPDSAHQPDLEYYIMAICAIDWAISELLLINREGET